MCVGEVCVSKEQNINIVNLVLKHLQSYLKVILF